MISSATTPRRRASLAALVLATLLCAPFPAAAASDTVAARLEKVARPLKAYGQVVPLAVLPIRAGEPATIGRLAIMPGSPVQAGQVLARLTGPRLTALLTARAQASRAAAARAVAARRIVAITRRRLALHLSTRQTLNTAVAEMAAAEATRQTALARLRAARAQARVTAPVAGTILALHAAAGERIAGGQTLLTLLPAGKVWLRATYYGSDADRVHVGMIGRFTPTGGTIIPMRVAAIDAGLAADGGMRVGLVPVAKAPSDWRDGAWGSVTLSGPIRRLVMVPSTALILNRGAWWVLVRTPEGDRRQKVVPGPTRGWNTAILSGLRAGQKVVTVNAFLDFHQGVAHSYQPPD